LVWKVKAIPVSFYRAQTDRCYKTDKNIARYKKQKEASDKVNKHTNNLYSAEIYNVSMVH